MISRFADLATKVRLFVDGRDRSMTLAGEIEVMLTDLFDEEEPYASVALAVASYRPGGGAYLYDGEQIAKMLMPVLKCLEAAAK